MAPGRADRHAARCGSKPPRHPQRVWHDVQLVQLGERRSGPIRFWCTILCACTATGRVLASLLPGTPALLASGLGVDSCQISRFAKQGLLVIVTMWVFAPSGVCAYARSTRSGNPPPAPPPPPPTFQISRFASMILLVPVVGYCGRRKLGS